MQYRREISPSKAELVRHLRPGRAANVLIQSHADCAGEEALSRALLAERETDAARAMFWVGVYEQIHRARSERK